eukprot:TRINITY_DN13752_c0_g1_i1.p1 TRINITY_DN13752_c0_g1~~TRINITY_DN13752_c0_g1_i1.p1  ORF type:complete len:683 (-),score=209.29 TRINITY_DN13752_c0_g1_i1:84-2132(-)
MEHKNKRKRQSPPNNNNMEGDDVLVFENEEKRDTDKLYEPQQRLLENSHTKSLENYEKMYKESIENPSKFWKKFADETIDWFKPYDKVLSGSMEDGSLCWFRNGKLNVSFNCIDRHLEKNKDKIAIIWEGDRPGTEKKITYGELHTQVCKLANVLKYYGVRRGDAVAIYLPMIPEAAVAMLACARIGAIHSVIFGGFSSDAIRERVVDAKCKLIITADEGIRGGRLVPLKKNVDEAVLGLEHLVQKVIIYKRTENAVKFIPERDLWWHEEVSKQRGYCPPEEMDSEDPLFMLYTSGSTGKPKGLVHTQAGYLLYTSITHKYVFDYHEDDIYACVADVGWITGHSYVVYGPLANGATTVMFESTPLYPNENRYWEMIQKYKINIFYTAPTAIRAVMKVSQTNVSKYDLSSLRVLGTVGEPINPSAWEWYYHSVGGDRCDIVDTYWQTETGGILITPLPGITPTKPGSATRPFFGIEPHVLSPTTHEVMEQNDVRGVLAIKKPWPSIARTIYGDHERYLNTYLRVYPGYYFTGDGVYRDKDGYYWVIGRVDDVINVSGHRLGTAELESALVSHPACPEAAVIAIPDDVRGSSIVAFCVLREGYVEDEKQIHELKQQVRHKIGPFATPSEIIFSSALPKTRSGKIMRRILRKIACKEFDSLGDLTTLENKDVIERLIEKVKNKKK